MRKDESELIWEQYTEQANTDKKPDEDGDGVPDWADKKTGKDDHAEEDDKEHMNEAKPGSALDMLGLEPDDFGHEDPDQAAFDRSDAAEDDSPFEFDDEPEAADVVDLSKHDRPSDGDRAEMLLDVIKMLEDKTFDYSFDIDNGTMKLKSEKGDQYILKLVGAAGESDIPVSLR